MESAAKLEVVGGTVTKSGANAGVSGPMAMHPAAPVPAVAKPFVMQAKPGGNFGTSNDLASQSQANEWNIDDATLMTNRIDQGLSYLGSYSNLSYAMEARRLHEMSPAAPFAAILDTRAARIPAAVGGGLTSGRNSPGPELQRSHRDPSPATYSVKSSSPMPSAYRMNASSYDHMAAATPAARSTSASASPLRSSYYSAAPARSTSASASPLRSSYDSAAPARSTSASASPLRSYRPPAGSQQQIAVVEHGVHILDRRHAPSPVESTGSSRGRRERGGGSPYSDRALSPVTAAAVGGGLPPLMAAPAALQPGVVSRPGNSPPGTSPATKTTLYGTAYAPHAAHGSPPPSRSYSYSPTSTGLPLIRSMEEFSFYV